MDTETKKMLLSLNEDREIPTNWLWMDNSRGWNINSYSKYVSFYHRQDGKQYSAVVSAEDIFKVAEYFKSKSEDK